MRVGFFVTCLVDLMRPSIGFAAVRLLEAAGAEVVVPARQTCCGQPAYNSGDRRDAIDLARKVIDMVIEGEIRNQDSTWVTARTIRNRHVRGDAWRHLRSRWDEAWAAFPPFTHRHFAEGLSGFFEPELAREVQAFFAESPMKTATKSTEQHLELMNVHVSLYEREAERR